MNVCVLPGSGESACAAAGKMASVAARSRRRFIGSARMVDTRPLCAGSQREVNRRLAGERGLRWPRADDAPPRRLRDRDGRPDRERERALHRQLAAGPCLAAAGPRPFHLLRGRERAPGRRGRPLRPAPRGPAAALPAGRPPRDRPAGPRAAGRHRDRPGRARATTATSSSSGGSPAPAAGTLDSFERLRLLRPGDRRLRHPGARRLRRRAPAAHRRCSRRRRCSTRGSRCGSTRSASCSSPTATTTATSTSTTSPATAATRGCSRAPTWRRPGATRAGSRPTA